MGGNSYDRFGGTSNGDGTLVAVFAGVLIDLQIERTVAKRVAAGNALAAADAKFFVDRVFVVGIFDEGPSDRSGRAELVFGPGVFIVGIGVEVAGARVAVATHLVVVFADNGRLGKNAMGRATSTPDALCRIDLPACIGVIIAT